MDLFRASIILRNCEGITPYSTKVQLYLNHSQAYISRLPTLMRTCNRQQLSCKDCMVSDIFPCCCFAIRQRLRCRSRALETLGTSKVLHETYKDVLNNGCLLYNAPFVN